MAAEKQARPTPTSTGSYSVNMHRSASTGLFSAEPKTQGQILVVRPDGKTSKL
jgi:hypothetical protein